eukprot:TRINITY_DN9492_c0_g1_i1.p2 TRINITY_DN9492_c0_g1~~TRINITY_DN9492_c0_g1_i1.p2  ORF type:complete len:239 (-),score=-8.70 TRINITY_DN9492_c0_g1_i1:345-1034(-)
MNYVILETDFRGQKQARRQLPPTPFFPTLVKPLLQLYFIRSTLNPYQFIRCVMHACCFALQKRYNSQTKCACSICLHVGSYIFSPNFYNIQLKKRKKKFVIINSHTDMYQDEYVYQVENKDKFFLHNTKSILIQNTLKQQLFCLLNKYADKKYQKNCQQQYIQIIIILAFLQLLITYNGMYYQLAHQQQFYINNIQRNIYVNLDNIILFSMSPLNVIILQQQYIYYVQY